MPGSGVEHFILFLCLFVSGRTVVAHRANIYFTGRISQRGGHTALRPFPASFFLSPPFYLSFFFLLFFFFLFYFNRADRIFARERVPRRDYGKGREIPSLSGPRIYFFFSFSFFFPSRVGRRVGFEGWRFFGRRKRFGVEKKLGEKKFGGLRNGLANGPVFAKHGIHAAICRRCRFRWCVQKCLPLAYVTSASPPCIRLFTRYLLISLVPSLSLFLSFSLSPPSALSFLPPSLHHRAAVPLVSVANDPCVGNLLWAAYAAPPKAKRKFALNQIRWNFLSVVCTYRGRPGLAACFRLVLLSMMNLR